MSPKKKLILIYGNEHFGFEHINNRHSNSPKKTNWQTIDKAPLDITNRLSPKLDSPSRFSNQTIPFEHYTKIADEIFDKQNLNSAKNKKPNILDLYIGKTDKNATNELKEYRLLVYKKSKIIHTLFPTDSKTKNKRKGQFNFERMSPKGKYTFGKEEILIHLEVPYCNYYKEIRYVFIIRRFFVAKMERLYIQVNEPRGKPAFTHLISEQKHNYKFDQKYFDEHTALYQIQYANLKNIENYIGKLEKKYFPNKRKATDNKL